MDLVLNEMPSCPTCKCFSSKGGISTIILSQDGRKDLDIMKKRLSNYIQIIPEKKCYNELYLSPPPKAQRRLGRGKTIRL